MALTDSNISGVTITEEMIATVMRASLGQLAGWEPGPSRLHPLTSWLTGRPALFAGVFWRAGWPGAQRTMQALNLPTVPYPRCLLPLLVFWILPVDGLLPQSTESPSTRRDPLSAWHTARTPDE